MTVAVQVVRSLRELDALVETHVFGAKCLHSSERVPAAVIAVDVAKDFEAEHHHPPSAEWALSQAEFTQDTDYPETWCAKCHVRRNRETAGECWKVRPFSSGIADAWKVVEKFPVRVLLEQWMGTWTCTFHVDFGEYGDAEHRSPMIAICLAALRAHGIDVTLEIEE